MYAIRSYYAYTNAYFDYKDGNLYIMNDWYYNDAGTIDPGCYNLFLAYTAGGTEAWQAKVYANGTAQVFKNGVLQDPVATPAIKGAVITSYSIHYTKLYDTGRNGTC